MKVSDILASMQKTDEPKPFVFPPSHVRRWDAFLAQHPDPAALIEEQKAASFRYGWDNPERNVDDHHQALFEWQMMVMEEVGWFNLGGPPQTVETVDDPALFRF